MRFLSYREWPEAVSVPHEVEPWFHSWYRGRVDAKALFELLVWPHEVVEPWFHIWYRGRVETLDAKYNILTPLYVATPTVQKELPRHDPLL